MKRAATSTDGAPRVPNKPRDKAGDLAYERLMIGAAAVYFGYWFSYPLTLAEAGPRSI